MSDDAVRSTQAIGEEPAKQSKVEREKQQAVQSFGKTDPTGQLSMRVLVHSPFRNYYDGPAFSISAENATGPFDILPRHHNFISLLSPCDVVVRSVDRGEQRIQISGGIMHVKADKVSVFLDV